MGKRKKEIERRIGAGGITERIEKPGGTGRRA
jgi:hypothetical protein